MAAIDKKYLVPASSLVSPEHQGWLTKLGEKVKNWKRRYFILRAGVLYYYKKSDAPKPQGVVVIKKGVKAFKFDHKKSPYTFAVQTDNRTYYMYGDTSSDMDGWLSSIRNALEQLDVAPNLTIKGMPDMKPAAVIATITPTAVAPPTVPVTSPATVDSLVVAPAATANTSITSSTGEFDFSKIPQHVLLHILSYLDVQSLRRVDQVGKHLHTVARRANFVATCLARAKATSGTSVATPDPRVKFQNCKQAVKWLVTSQQVSEFWDIFTAQVPKPGAPAGTVTGSISFSVTSSLDQQKTTWRAEGPQHLFITPMVDFFVRVGAPDAEIDKLNHFGALITPPQIGFWIDVSQAGGLDGGWYFPFREMPLDTILDALEPGACTLDIKAWVKKHWRGKPATCFFFGRDMGMEPPRQTELRIELPPLSLHSQWKIIIDAYDRFQFPKPPAAVLETIKSSLAHSSVSGSVRSLALSVTVSSDDHFVKIAVLQEAPPLHLLPTLFCLQGHSVDQFVEFLKVPSALGSAPQWLEYQFLHETYGYRVYPHGFSAGVSYLVGQENTYA